LLEPVAAHDSPGVAELDRVSWNMTVHDTASPDNYPDHHVAYDMVRHVGRSARPLGPEVDH